MKKTGKFDVDVKPGKVSWIFDSPDQPKGLVVLSHGAGANMLHSSMEDYAKLLVELELAVFRFNFPYLEEGKGGPNRAPVLIDTICRAVEKSQDVYLAKLKKKPLKLYFAGKSMGGRMGSLAQAEESLGIQGMIFFGFPLHAPGKDGFERAAHLVDIKVPLLFLQGTRDTLARLDLISEVVRTLPLGTLAPIEGADHSFKILKRSGRTPEEVLEELTAEIREWLLANKTSGATAV